MMQIECDEKALQWFRAELGLSSGDAIRFFVKYGGDGAVHPGFSLGICRDIPKNVAVETDVDGIKLFVRDEDVWYFSDRSLSITAESDDVAYNVI